MVPGAWLAQLIARLEYAATKKLADNPLFQQIVWRGNNSTRQIKDGFFKTIEDKQEKPKPPFTEQRRK